jgi:hypothetical protein
MSMVTMLQAVIDANLSKSNLTISLTLIMQLAGYGKLEDDLSDSRLEQLSGLRRDRARAAVRDVVGMGLFEIAGKGKYGTIYRIPKRFLCGSGYIGFNTHLGASETDAYAYPEEDQEPSVEHPAIELLYQQLVETNRMLVEANQILVNTNRDLVETHRHLVSKSPIYGESPTEARLNVTPVLVTDINKPKHNLTPTPSFPNEERPVAISSLPISKTDRINAEALQYPCALSAEERVNAPQKLDGLNPGLAQDVLDVLAWKMANETVKSPIGLLVYMANTAREGTLDRTPAFEWRKTQQLAQAKENAIRAVELNNLAIEIKNIQRLHKESGEKIFLKQAEVMKADYFQKLEIYKTTQDIPPEMEA